MTLYRVQDRDGRGPFKPGFSAMWRDADGPALPPFFVEMGIPLSKIPSLFPDGFAGGCACRSMNDLCQWFSRRELRRLRRHGYEVVAFEPDLIIAETPTQVVFGMRQPLSVLARAA